MRRRKMAALIMLLLSCGVCNLKRNARPANANEHLAGEEAGWRVGGCVVMITEFLA